MTADHPTREERYAAVIAQHQRILDAPGSCICGDWPPPEFDVEWTAHVAAALVTADPAPAQPDAALSDDEREALRRDLRRLVGAHADVVLNDLLPTIAAILAARAAQPVPAPERACPVDPQARPCSAFPGRYACCEPQPVPAPEVSRGVVEETDEYRWGVQDATAIWMTAITKAKAEALRSQRDFFRGIDMEAAADHCEQAAIAYDSAADDRARADRLVHDALCGERGEEA